MKRDYNVNDNMKLPFMIKSVMKTISGKRWEMSTKLLNMRKFFDNL